MSMIDRVHEYNSELKEFLSEVWGIVPKGRKKQFAKNPRIKALLVKFGLPLE